MSYLEKLRLLSQNRGDFAKKLEFFFNLSQPLGGVHSLKGSAVNSV
jgi:hypothetical protein